MWRTGENPRGLHAVEVLHDIHPVTLDTLIAAGYDPHLITFDVMLPGLIDAYDQLQATDPRKADLKEPVELLRHWDHRASEESVATAVAIFWGEAVINHNRQAALSFDEPVYAYLVDGVTPEERLDALGAAIGCERTSGNGTRPGARSTGTSGSTTTSSRYSTMSGQAHPLA
jgi:acyl-homoserine-lactone acylase